MAYTQTELLAGFLAVACLVLLYCYYHKKQSSEGFAHKASNLPGLALGRRSGMHNHVPNLAFNKNVSGYTRPGLDGMDNGPVASLQDMEYVGNIAGQHVANAVKANPLVEAKWEQDMSIQVNQHEVTNKDRNEGGMAFGHELYGVDHAALVGCGAPKPLSLGGELLTKTDYTPEYNTTSARGSVTY